MGDSKIQNQRLSFLDLPFQTMSTTFDSSRRVVIKEKRHITANDSPTTILQPKVPSMIKHFSHSHILKPMEVEQKNASTTFLGLVYCCTEPHCTFNLHKACFYSPVSCATSPTSSTRSHY